MFCKILLIFTCEPNKSMVFLCFPKRYPQNRFGKIITGNKFNGMDLRSI